MRSTFRPRTSAERRSTFSATERAASFVLGSAALLVPTLVTSTGIDYLRLPKELAFVAAAILLAVIGVFAATTRQATWRLPVRREIVLALVIAGWTITTTVTSTNRDLSEQSLVTVLAGVIVFASILIIASKRRMEAFDLLLVAAVINAILACLQEYGVWNPFRFPADQTGHLRTTALIGNPNDVGSYLVAPALATFVAATVASGKRRWGYWITSGVLALGLIASATRTALLAYGMGLLVLALGRSRRQAMIIVLLITTIAAVITLPSTKLGQGLGNLLVAATQHRYDILLSERLPPFLSAAEMSRMHPIVGVGPGCFKFHYMDVRQAINSRYPAEWTRGWPGNFGETHNDHLQVLAETGIPGYGLFLAAVLFVAFPRWRRLPGDENTRPRALETNFARTLRVPLAAVFIVLTLAQFPLQLAAPRFMFLALAGLCAAWERSNVD